MELLRHAVIQLGMTSGATAAEDRACDTQCGCWPARMPGALQHAVRHLQVIRLFAAETV